MEWCFYAFLLISFLVLVFSLVAFSNADSIVILYLLWFPCGCGCVLPVACGGKREYYSCELGIREHLRTQGVDNVFQQVFAHVFGGVALVHCFMQHAVESHAMGKHGEERRVHVTGVEMALHTCHQATSHAVCWQTILK